MNVNVNKFAEAFGLEIYEAKAYLALTKTGPANVSQIAKAAALPRTAVYAPLKTLVAKGYVGTIMFGRRKLYQAVRPERMKYILEQRKLEGDRLLDEILNSGLISSPTNDLAIQYFEGQHGISTAGQIFLDETREKMWYSFENPVGVTELVGLDFESNYVMERVKRGIRSRMILTVDVPPPWLKEFLKRDAEQLRESITLSPRQYRFDSTVAMTRGLVLLINALENPFAVLIRNDRLAATLISIHRLVWERYR